MKTSIIVLVTTLAAGAFATPQPESLPALEARKACYHSSTCSWFNAAKCEQYCRQWGQQVGVDRMEKCNFLNQKRCCCTS